MNYMKEISEEAYRELDKENLKLQGENFSLRKINESLESKVKNVKSKKDILGELIVSMNEDNNSYKKGYIDALLWVIDYPWNTSLETIKYDYKHF